jgi:hypothetical protein
VGLSLSKTKESDPMAKVTIADITIRYRDVEIPEKCPSCGRSFTEPESANLREVDYVDQYMYGWLMDEEGDRKVWEPAGTPSYGQLEFGESNIVVGYSCACTEVLVSGKETREG